jgi:hypothetical protein
VQQCGVHVAGVGLREVDVGVDESRQQKPGPMIEDRRRSVLRRNFRPVTAERDVTAVVEHQRAVGN